MDNFRQFITGSVFFLVASVSLLLFCFAYPEAQGYESILNKDPSINESIFNLTTQFGDYQPQANIEKNASTIDIPEVGAESIQLVSTVSTTRSQWSRVTESFKVIYILVANSLGLSAGTFTALLGALFSLITIIALLLLWKVVRTGD